MTAAAMAAVEILGVPGEKLSHEGADPTLAALEQEVSQSDFVMLS
jgi:hypothetical protein